MDILFEEPDKKIEFVQANETLIKELGNYPIAKILEENHTFYKEHNLIFRYAQTQLGLARNLDFNLDSNLAFSSPLYSSLIITIVNLARSILQIHSQQCGKHEDGACMFTGIQFQQINKNLSRQDWPTLPLAHALSFVGNPIADILREGKHIYRITDTNHQGHWWMETKPNSRYEWRSEFAVSEKWNKGTTCLKGILKEDLPVWKGTTAPQPVPASPANCYLAGSGEQIWLEFDSNKIEIIATQAWTTP